VAVEVAHLTIDYLTKGIIRNGVNVPSVDPETLAQIGPYLDLAGRMGRFLGQLVEDRMEELEIRYSGEVAAADRGR